MNSFELTPAGLRDLDEIIANAIEFRGEDAAERIETQLLEACDRLARTPGLGHRRQDLTSKRQYFYPVEPYLVVYVRDSDPLRIIAILHSSRNIRKLLRPRAL